MKHFLRTLVVAGCLGTTLVGASAEIAGPLKTLRAVGQERLGNAAFQPSTNPLIHSVL